MVDIEIFKEFGAYSGGDVEVVRDVVLLGRMLSLLVLMVAARGLLPVTLRIRLFHLLVRLGEELLLDEVLEQHAIELARLTLRLAWGLVLHNSRQLPKNFLLQSWNLHHSQIAFHTLAIKFIVFIILNIRDMSLFGEELLR